MRNYFIATSFNDWKVSGEYIPTSRLSVLDLEKKFLVANVIRYFRGFYNQQNQNGNFDFSNSTELSNLKYSVVLPAYTDDEGSNVNFIYTDILSNKGITDDSLYDLLNKYRFELYGVKQPLVKICKSNAIRPSRF